MSDEPISLAKARADKANDCRLWSPRDAVEDVLKRIDGGEQVEKVYIAMQVRVDDKLVDHVYQIAGCSKLEALGLLTYHMHLQSGTYEF